jgi:hypothetical protein
VNSTALTPSLWPIAAFPIEVLRREADLGGVLTGAPSMLDILYLALGVGLFGLLAGYVAVCDRL